MNKELEESLFRRWPAVFRGRNRPPTETSMDRGCVHGDGWYAILDALCEVLTTHAKNLGRLPPEAKQVKEKLAGLRFYVGDPTDEFDWGAIAMAQMLSLRICEISGQPGRNCSREGSGYATLSPRVARQRRFVTTLTDANRPLPPVPEAPHLLATRWPQVLVGPVKLPGGWYDVADILLECLGHSVGDEKAVVARVVELGQKNECLVAQLEGGGLREMGLAALAAAVSNRIDPATGAAGV